jgi:hypothetical protein
MAARGARRPRRLTGRRVASLLAVDVGVRTGLACFGDDGRLRWYRSHNLGDAARLRRAIPGLLDAEGDLTRVVLEGGGPLAEAWAREATRRGLEVTRVSAELWRPLFLLPRELRDSASAKAAADRVARRVIAQRGGARPTSLRHDAAEAVLIGLWGLMHAGWVRELGGL